MALGWHRLSECPGRPGQRAGGVTQLTPQTAICERLARAPALGAARAAAQAGDGVTDLLVDVFVLQQALDIGRDP
jgi:hypothetical protein